jgi:hypothetical protein
MLLPEDYLRQVQIRKTVVTTPGDGVTRSLRLLQVEPKRVGLIVVISPLLQISGPGTFSGTITGSATSITLTTTTSPAVFASTSTAEVGEFSASLSTIAAFNFMSSVGNLALYDNGELTSGGGTDILGVGLTTTQTSPGPVPTYITVGEIGTETFGGGGGLTYNSITTGTDNVSYDMKDASPVMSIVGTNAPDYSTTGNLPSVTATTTGTNSSQIATVSGSVSSSNSGVQIVGNRIALSLNKPVISWPGVQDAWFISSGYSNDCRVEMEWPEHGPFVCSEVWWTVENLNTRWVIMITELLILGTPCRQGYSPEPYPPQTETMPPLSSSAPPFSLGPPLTGGFNPPPTQPEE